MIRGWGMGHKVKQRVPFRITEKKKNFGPFLRANMNNVFVSP
jgi:hypothetical protein